MTKLIAFDLDNTLLNSKKEVTPENLRVLTKAASLGIEIVPVTGRIWSGVPESVKSMKFVRYAVTLNGANIIDVKSDKTIAESLMPSERGITLCRVIDELPVVYDCIADGVRFMTRRSYDNIDTVAAGKWQADIIRASAKPVDDVCEELAKSRGVQKMQIYTLDAALRESLLKALPVVFPKALFTSAVSNNIEINDLKANKGDGLRLVADHLNIPMSATMAFGDGLNDIAMIRAAGIGVAMGNACREVLEAADHVTTGCEHDGVAEGIKTLLPALQEHR